MADLEQESVLVAESESVQDSKLQSSSSQADLSKYASGEKGCVRSNSISNFDLGQGSKDLD